SPARTGTAIDADVPHVPLWRAVPDRREAVLREIAAWAPDIVYCHGLMNVEWEAELARAHPAILFAHNYAGTCISGTKRRAFPWARPCGKVLGPLCLGLYHICRCGGLSPKTMLRHYREQRRRQRLFTCYR